MHRYFKNEEEARSNALSLDFQEFQQIFSYFLGYKTTVILGLNELLGDKIYNTAVVIEDGNLLGKAQKFTTYPPYDYYAVGSQDHYSIFYKNNIGFGILICCDINYLNFTSILSKKGAQIVFCPM